ncbi:transposase [Gilliamella apicola]|nr:transposase [Gilliamella apicola]
MTINLTRREKRSFTNEFKKQMVMLYQNGKKRADIVAQYDLTKSALDNWITQYQTTGSFTAKDNRSAEENDILKQAALIMGRKSS